MNKKALSFFLLLFFAANMIFANPFYSPPSDNSSQQPETEEEQKPTGKKIQDVRRVAPNKTIVKAQRTLSEKIADFFKIIHQEKNNNSSRSSVLWTFLSVSFLYGLIHAAGPGHRKTVIFSFYLTRVCPWWEPALMGIASAFLHGASTIVLMLIFKGVTGSIAQNSSDAAIYMEGFSYLILIISSAVLLIIAIVEFIRSKAGHTHKHLKNVNLIPFLLSGIYPCPGAILVLILSLTLDMLGLGIAVVLVMSLGMCVPITAAAYFAWAGKKGLFFFLKNREQLAATIASIFEVTGYACLLVISLFIALPFLKSLI